MTQLALRLEAYASVDITTAQTSVLWAIRENPGITAEGIARYLGWGVNRVSGRVGELRDSGRIVEAGVAVNPSGRRATAWRSCE